jgi:hypothetical protein
VYALSPAATINIPSPKLLDVSLSSGPPGLLSVSEIVEIKLIDDADS